MHLEKEGGPREPSSAEQALIGLMNFVDPTWGDHFRQEKREESATLPIPGNDELNFPEAALDIHVMPDGEMDDNGVAEEPALIEKMKVRLELRERGEEEPQEAVAFLMPCDRDYRLSAEDDAALLAFLRHCRHAGAKGIEIADDDKGR